MSTDPLDAKDSGGAIVPMLADCYRAILDAVELPLVVASESPNLVTGRTPVKLEDFNRIMVTSLGGDPSEAEIDAALDGLRDVAALSCWLPIGPHEAGVRSRFETRGFLGHADGAGVPAMWVATADLAPLALPPGVTIEQVASVESSDLAIRVAVEGFGVPPPFEAPMADLFRPVATRPTSPLRIFLARLDGRPVATAVCVVSGEVVGIYNVATVPDARGRGIGGAVTLAAALDGRDRGARTAVLESSPMGFPVYQRLGFEVAARYQVLTRTIA